MMTRHIAVVLGALCLLPAGCASATIEDAVPAAAMQPATNDRVFSAPGEYPNLNVRPAPAAAQFTDEELKAQTDALRARRAQQEQEASARGAADRSAELSRLGRSHADAALEEIGSE